MNERRRTLALIVAFVALLGFHLWLLQRTVAAQNTLLASLLVVAVAVFAWRIAHYGRRFRRPITAPGASPADEARNIRLYVPILVAVLALKAWLISVLWTAGEVLFVAILVGAITLLAIRLALYGRRWTQLRRISSADGPDQAG